MEPVIVVHGGAGRRLKASLVNKRLKFLEKAVRRGYDVLARGGSALDAVVEAVIELENSGVFNAGVGSCLTIDGCVEMDAGLMDGRTGNIGAVAAVRRVRNPILLARKVMELTDHILFVGEGAEKLAEVLGLSGDPSLFVSDEKLKLLERYKKEWLEGKKFTWLVKLKELREKYPQFFGTVGAVALDKEGNLAAASSTGGYWLKMRGRVGDTPIPGAGFYATTSGAASATGVGEVIIKIFLTYTACKFIEEGFSAGEAAREAIALVTRMHGANTAGIIVLDKRGEIGYEFNTQAMSVAYKKGEEEKVLYLERK